MGETIGVEADKDGAANGEKPKSRPGANQRQQFAPGQALA